MRLQIEQRTDLALRALRLLENQQSNMRAREMAPVLETTAQYLPQVLRPLVTAGWLYSDPGPTGGYRLATDLGERSLLELIEVLEGPISTDICVLKGGPCGDMELCALHIPWFEARTALLESLSGVSVSGMVTKEKENV